MVPVNAEGGAWWVLLAPLVRGCLEGDDGEVGRKRGVTVGKENPPLIQEGSLGNFTPLGPSCGSGSLDHLLSSFTKNLSNDTCFCLCFRMPLK